MPVAKKFRQSLQECAVMLKSSQKNPSALADQTNQETHRSYFIKFAELVADAFMPLSQLKESQ